MKHSERYKISFRRLPDGALETEKGREAWLLKELVKVGERGLTALDYVGTRVAAYVGRLRERGIAIESTSERHGGMFPGSHSRYRLKTKILIIDEESCPAEPETERAA